MNEKFFYDPYEKQGLANRRWRMKISNLNELLDSKELEAHQSDTLFNIQYHILNTDVDVDNMIKANKIGNYGLTHQNFIDSWREFLDTLRIFDPQFDELEGYLDGEYDLHNSVFQSILKEIDKCEQYHIAEDTINDEI